MSILKWLHLSDFHLGKDGYAEQRLCTMLINQLKEQIDGNESIDTIFVTGDIAYEGIQSQYRDFETFLLEVDELFPDGKVPRIYVVPGNHDVDRTQNSMIQSSLYKYKSEKDFTRLLDPTKEGLDLRNQIMPRFRGFADTFEASLCFSTKGMFSEKGYYIDSILKEGISVGIAGINTSWLACSNQDKNHITPGNLIVKEAINDLKKYDYRIMLGHHPLYWFQSEEGQIIESLIAKNNIIYLYGHIHKDEVGHQMAISGKSYMRLGTGAAFLTRATDILQHSIQYGELNEDGIKIRPLKWSEAQQEWILNSPEYFPAANHVAATDYWFFPFSPETAFKKAKRPSSLKPEWVLLTKEFINQREKVAPSKEEMLMFFDGKAPEYSFAFSDQIPIRRKTNDYVKEFEVAEKNGKNKCMLITGAGGEGKSTQSLQVIYQLVMRNWTVLHCADPEKNTIIRLSDIEKLDGPVLIAVDNASVIAKEMFNFLQMAKQNEKSVHLLLISEFSEWLYSKAQDLQWDDVADFSSKTLAGIELEEARDIVAVWSQYGKEGLGTLSECQDPEAAAMQLYKVAQSPLTTQSKDGALLGAIIQTRYKDAYYKEHVRMILKRLQDIPLELPNTEDTLLEAFVRIALVHREKLDILGSDILAEIYHCKESDIKRKILRPLGREAMTSKSGGVIYVRHSALADCVMNIVEEEFRHIEWQDYLPEMAAAAVSLRTNGKYVYKVEEWRYLADHFLDKGMKRLAVHIAEAVYEVDESNDQVLSHLLTVYLSEPGPAYDIAYDCLAERSDEIYDDALLNAYEVSAGHLGKNELRAYLAYIALSDRSYCLNGALHLGLLIRDCVEAANALYKLSILYQNEKFEKASYAMAKIAELIGKKDKSIPKLECEILKQTCGYTNDRKLLEKQIDDGMKEVIKMLSFDKLPDSVPKPTAFTFSRLLNKI